ncbi:hypothetical protein ACFO9E_18155 [Streptomyces maoxianensis]|uniref:Uncharacterized protein n=1 Tax=Streptomyces maoxianensis TaxID=1459942 RepID=A0ABV9G6Z6_9ACTN
MRIQPAGPPSAYKTYSIKAPLSTHFRHATCEEVACPDFLYGWRVRKENLTPALLHTATHCGRKYTELHVAEGETYLVYEAGQSCFQSARHRTRVERPELYIVRDGDHRGNPRGTPNRIHKRAEDWAEDLHEHTDKLNTTLKEG